jgi:AraC-like DNA-binding protein
MPAPNVSSTAIERLQERESGFPTGSPVLLEKYHGSEATHDPRKTGLIEGIRANFASGTCTTLDTRNLPKQSGDFSLSYGKFLLYPQVMKTFDATRPDFAPYGLTCERWTSAPMVRPDRHNEIELNLLLEGSLTYLFGGARVTIRAGSLAAFWAAIPHQILGPESMKSDADYYVVTIPLTWFLQLKLPDRLLHPILHGRFVCERDEGKFPSDRERFERWIEDLGGDQPDRRRAAFLEIEARLLRLALSLPPHKPGPHKGKMTPATLNEGRLSKAEQMARYVAQHYTASLAVEEISRSVGLHPGYAMTLFQKTFGMTLIEYITQHRLSHAQRLLATTDEKVLSIALDSGFGSLSRFNDAFRRAFGCTPRQHRKNYQGSS